MSSTVVKQNRHYGIDLFRIVSMFLVVLLHIVGVGGIVDNTSPLSANYVIACFFNCASYCAVNCYALISGYVGLKSKPKFANLGLLWLQAAFYSVVISALFFVFKISDAEYYNSWTFLINSFLPVMNNRYWYFTAYVVVWLFMPLMNTAVENLSAIKLKAILIIAGVLMIPVSMTTDAFLINGGFSAIWLGYLYLIGAYVKKTDCFKDKPSMRYLLMYFGCVIISLFAKITLVAMGRSGSFLERYISPLILFSAIALLAFFINVKIPQRLVKIIAFVSPLAFGVFLIHMQEALFATFFSKKFGVLADSSPFVLLFAIIGFAIAIFSVCALIDYLRKLLFDLLRIKKFLVFIEGRAKKLFLKVMQR